jgi:hypothetical protein
MPDSKRKDLAILAALALGAMLILGYHPGLEDDAFYLAAIRRQLNPALFPRDSDFFTLQFQATIFDKLIAWSVRITRIPLEWAALLWQFAAVFVTLWAAARIAGRCFPESRAKWTAVALLAAVLGIPVSGTGIALMDQYLHPRALASAAILCAVAMTLERRFRIAACLLALAASLHVIMAAFGVSLCLFLAWPNPSRQAAAMLLPLGWLFDPPTEAWKKAAATRTFYFLARQEWYEWLGVLAPVLLLELFHRIARRNRLPALAHLARRLVWFAIFQFAVALAIMLPPDLERLRPFEPMRYLHLVYVFLFLLGGGLLGQYVLKGKLLREALLFAPLCAGMWFAQLQMYPSTPHFELPGAVPANRWVRAFAWIRANTPERSYFALDPEYMALPGEDFHGFRALAARGALADNLKDPGMAARVPRLADRWWEESQAQTGWKNFEAADFRRLRAAFGVDWVVLDNASDKGLDCPYRDGTLRVCRLY